MSLLSVLEQLREFDTALLANTIGYIDTTPPHEYYMSSVIQSVTPALGPTVGLAVICEADTSTPAGDPNMDQFWKQLEEMNELNAPSVWVVKTIGSRPNHECVIGDGMAKLLRAAGCVGLVTDGGVRDISGLLSTPFAAYCRGRTIHHCALRFRKTDQPLNVGGIEIRARDVIHANVEGVIKIPQACLELLPERAAAMRAFEHEVHFGWRRTDLPLAEKRRQVGDLLSKYGFDGHNNRVLDKSAFRISEE